MKHLQTGSHNSEEQLLSPPAPPHVCSATQGAANAVSAHIPSAQSTQSVRSAQSQPPRSARSSASAAHQSRTVSSQSPDLLAPPAPPVPPTSSANTQAPSANSSDSPSEKEEQRRVGRNSLVMFSGTLASRLTGQIRTILLAAAIGVSGIAADAYQVGSQIPLALFNLLSGGIINAILVPQIVRAFRHDDSEERINKLLTLSGTILIGFTAILMVFSPLLVRLYTGASWTESQRALAEAFTLWCMPQVFFYGLYTVVGQVLATKDRFGMYAWSSVAANVVSCIGFTIFIALFGNASSQPVSFWTPDKTALTAGAWSTGVAVQALLLFIPLHQIGLHYHVRWGVRGIGLRSMGKVAGWSIAMVVLDELLNVIVTRITTTAPMLNQSAYDRNIPGSQAYMQGYQIWILPYSLIAVSVATAIFPVLSRAAASHDNARAGRTLNHALRQTSVLMFFFSAAFIALPVPIIRSLLPSVSVHDAQLVSSSLIGLAFCLPFATITLFLRRMFYAYEDGRTPFRLSVVIDVTEAILLTFGTAVLPARWWTFMVGWALTLANLAMVPFAIPLLRKRLGHHFEVAPTVIVYLKSFVACIVDIVVGRVLTGWLVDAFHSNINSPNGSLSWWKAVVISAIVGITMLVVYILLLKLMRTQEADAFMMLVRKVLPAKKSQKNDHTRQNRHPNQYNGTDSGVTSPAADGSVPPADSQA